MDDIAVILAALLCFFTKRKMVFPYNLFEYKEKEELIKIFRYNDFVEIRYFSMLLNKISFCVKIVYQICKHENRFVFDFIIYSHKQSP